MSGDTDDPPKSRTGATSPELSKQMPYKPDPELDDKISVLYQCGHSVTQVARRLGLNVGQVRSSLRRTNTRQRSISEAKKLRKAII
jgi:hypothetical protein